MLTREVAVKLNQYVNENGFQEAIDTYIDYKVKLLYDGILAATSWDVVLELKGKIKQLQSLKSLRNEVIQSLKDLKIGS